MKEYVESVLKPIGILPRSVVGCASRKVQWRQLVHTKYFISNISMRYFVNNGKTSLTTI